MAIIVEGSGSDNANYGSVNNADGSEFEEDITGVAAQYLSRSVSISSEDELRKFLQNSTSSTLDGMIGDVINGDRFDVHSLMGAPFKFSDSDDPVMSNDNGEYGRTYVEQFMAWGNILAISPGIATFLPGMSDEKKASIMSDMVSGSKDENQQLSTEEINKELEDAKAGKLYDFIPANRIYWDYVNAIWRHMIALAGLSGKESRLASYYTSSPGAGAIIGGKKCLEDISWQGVNNSSSLNKMLYGNIGSDSLENRDLTMTFVPFYHDGPFSISEASSNSAGESTYASKINQIPGNELAKELGFLTGATYADTDEYDKKAKNQKNSSGAIEKMMSLKSFGVKTIIPEVWKDSSSNKEIQFTFKTGVVAGTPDAYALNGLRTLAHWMAMALPIHSKGNFAYGAPLLCRIYAKGLPNIDIGMVTQIQINKNVKTMSTFGLACDMDITVTIRDMTPVMALPYSRKGFNANSAVGYMNLIGGLTGANVSLLDWKKLNIYMDVDALAKFISPTEIKRTLTNISRDFAGRGKKYVTRIGNISPFRN